MKKWTLFFLASLAGCDGTTSRTIERIVPVTFAEKFADAHGWTPLDYADSSHWECTADRTDDVCDKDFTMARLETDGTVGVTPYEKTEAPAIDCFFIYPTLDFNIFQGANHEGFDAVSLSLPRRTIEAQVGPFSSVCRVFAPYYRQGTFGGYLTTHEQSVWVFKNAFADVAAAFEHYLRHWNQGRPVVIIGHSQGAQHSSYLLHSYFDGDKEVTNIPGSKRSSQLRERLVMALPIGFSLYVPKGKVVGGIFSDIPVCTDAATPGCAIHYRSFSEGFEFANTGWSSKLNVRMAEDGLLYEPFDADKHVTSCVNPGLKALEDGRALDWNGNPVAPGDIRVLEGTYVVGVMNLLNAGTRTSQAEQHIPDRYTATCRVSPGGDEYLAIGYHEPVTGTDPRPDPFDIDGRLAETDLGLHIYDFNLPMGELIEHVRRRAEKF
jgi:hypothetical protein